MTDEVLSSNTKAAQANSIRPAEEVLYHLQFAQREAELLVRGGIIEVAVRNRNVAEYMKHWEGRAEKAEAKCAQLEHENAELRRTQALPCGKDSERAGAWDVVFEQLYKHNSKFISGANSGQESALVEIRRLQALDQRAHETTPLYRCQTCGTPMKCGPVKWEPQCQCSAQKAKGSEPAPLADRLAILGYAPGDYSIRCMDCKEVREGCDKRSLRCLRCAEAKDSQNGS